MEADLQMSCSMNKYFVTRGKLVSRVAKYPGLQDYLVRSNAGAQMGCYPRLENISILKMMVLERAHSPHRPPSLLAF
jgi:hypothetical protein